MSRLSPFSFIPICWILSYAWALIFLTSCTLENEASSSIAQAVHVMPLQPPSRTYWPTQAWRVMAPEKAGLNKKKLQELDTYAFTLTGKDEDRKGVRTNGLLIVKDGFIVYERYGRGFTQDSAHLTYSVAKCFINALVGIANFKGLLEIDKAAYHYFPDLNDLDSPEKRAITVRHLLNMSSGIEWISLEDVIFSWNVSTFRMLWGVGKNDMPAFAARLKMRTAPGTYVQYSSGDSMLLVGILRHVLGEERYTSYPWDVLFDMIGMRTVTLERDSAGNYLLFGFTYVPVRELAKFGFLYLNNGKWAGRRMLSEDWMLFTRTIAPVYGSAKGAHGWLKRLNMAAHWYVNTGQPSAGVAPSWANAPPDTFACLGRWRQRIFVIPSWDMVIVRVGDDRDHSWDNDIMFQLLSESLNVSPKNPLPSGS